MAENADTIKGLALVGLAAAGGYIAYKMLKKEGVPVEVGVEGAFGVQFSWINTGPASISPEFRVDIRRQADLLPFNIYTWQEGEWIPTDRVGPSQQSALIIIPAPAIPTDWIEGLGSDTTQIDVKLMARIPDGDEKEVWNKDGAVIAVGSV